MEFTSFIEDLLVDFHGFKREEKKEKQGHGPRKVGERPPKRTPGKRPPKLGKDLTPKQQMQLAKEREDQIRTEINRSIDQTKPSWYKKAWRKVMLEVHPDRVDIVSKDELDKFERLKIGERLRVDDSANLLIACANKLEIIIELNIYEQERKLRSANSKITGETNKIQQTVSWIWGEASVDTNLRLQIIKSVLTKNNIKPIDDKTLVEYIINKTSEE
tara:strand:- start:1586 stop:2236 length:651 start_codon:yes stop_codon:yes gene_type:complete